MPNTLLNNGIVAVAGQESCVIGLHDYTPWFGVTAALVVAASGYRCFRSSAYVLLLASSTISACRVDLFSSE